MDGAENGWCDQPLSDNIVVRFGSAQYNLN
jgi:hypothetical protein